MLFKLLIIFIAKQNQRKRKMIEVNKDQWDYR